MLELVGAVALVSGGYGFGRVAAFIARNLHDWWHPEKWSVDPFLKIFLVPTFAVRTMLGLGEPGRAASVSEAVAGSAVSLCLFGATAAVLLP
ncbi:MAG: hypothetical protein WD067_05230 [Gaiellaceae bacterium]